MTDEIETKTDPTAQERVSWFTEARFGMFIHFGLYSIPAGVWNGVLMGRTEYAEWIQMQGNWPHGIPAEEYRALAGQFNPTQFDADAWISQLAQAGMKYLVITSKHHDGFALWPSAVSSYNIVQATPFGRDLLGELRQACDRHGVRFGLYYSHWLDWEHPYGGRPHKEEFASEPRWEQPTDEQFEVYWQEKCLPQVRELIDNYDPALFWFDTWAHNSSPWINARRLEELIGTIRSRSPQCLINSRVGTWGHPQGNTLVDFVSMGDNEFPAEQGQQAWETSGTMSRSWGYHRLDFVWKPSREMLTNLIHNAARGGNYQLNVGPMADGRFPPPVVRRLREIGGWMAVNGESIYGTSDIPFGLQPWGVITARSLAEGRVRLYLHVQNGQPGETISVPGIVHPSADAWVLETGQPVGVQETPEGVALHLPADLTDTSLFVIVLEAGSGSS